MIRLSFAKLMAFAPLLFGCTLVFAVDVDRPDIAQSELSMVQHLAATELVASEAALAVEPAPSAPAPPIDLGHLLMQDARYSLSAPTRWDQGNWRDIGLVGLAVVGTAAVLDRPVRNAVQGNRNRTSDNIARIFEPFGAEYSLAVLGGFYVAGAVNDDPKAKAVAQDGLAASLIASGLITPALKLAVGRSRPAQDEGVYRFRPFGGNGSFPSGHTTEAFAVASVIASHYEPLWIKTTAYGVASLVGYARVYHNAHFTSDVLAGAAIGSLVGTALVRFNERLRGSGMSLAPIAVHKGVGFSLAKEF